ncbi:MAG TPA: hypothetical protein P5319_11850 [Gemmatimonadales bacterium]|nr:hypothetical protein [Gemmatimonadales bacterium]
MTMITPERREELAAQIEPLRQQVEAWRQSRSGRSEPMPEPLWEAATALAKSYGVSPVQRILRIDYRGLEYRALGVRKGKGQGRAARATGATFVELPALTPARRAEHLVELEDGTGRKLTVKVNGGSLSELVPLVEAFWRPSA